MDARAEAALREEDRELRTLLTMPADMWETAGPEVERRIGVLVRRFVLRSSRSTGSWSVLGRRCDICQQVQPSAQELVTHRYAAHTDGGRSTGPAPLYTCLMCHATSTRKHMLRAHIIREHQHVPANVPPPDQYSAPSAPDQRYKCTLCPKSYATNQNLKRHIGFHAGERPYECEVCHKRFSMYFNLVKHKRLHTVENPCECGVCHKRCTRSDHLVTHKRVHTGEKPYECDVCHKRFARSDYLAIHKRVHTGERPYKCDVCHKSFTQSANLSVHKRLHTGEKLYECDVCHKRFAYSNSRNTHKKIHTRRDTQGSSYIRRNKLFKF